MCLPIVWQDHVVRTYSTKEGQEVRDEDKHIASTITGIRKLIYLGMSSTERERLQTVASSGKRISYLPCTEWNKRGTCKYGIGCSHPHVG